MAAIVSERDRRSAEPEPPGLADDQAPQWPVVDRAAGPLDDPEAYHAFVRMLYAKIEAKLATPLAADAQAELAELTRFLMIMPRKAVDEHRVAFETAFDLLAAATPNILLVRNLRLNLETAEQRQSSLLASLLARLILRLCGATPLTAVLAALASVLVLSLLAVVVMAQGHQWLKGMYNVVDLQVGQINVRAWRAHLAHRPPDLLFAKPGQDRAGRQDHDRHRGPDHARPGARGRQEAPGRHRARSRPGRRTPRQARS